MGHGIEQDEDFGYAASEGRPWHGRGRPFPGGGLATPREAQTFVLGWRVLEEPIARPTGEIISSKKSLIRSDTARVLGVVGSGHTPLQNEDVAEVLEGLFGDVPVVDTVAALGGGARTSFLAKIPDGFEVREGDRIDRFFLVYNPYDGSSSVVVKFTAIRVVCGNALNLALSNHANEVRVRHTPGVKFGVETAAKILARGDQYWRDLRAFLGATRERQLTSAEWDQLLAQVVEGDSARAKNRRAFLTGLFDSAEATAPDGTRHTLDGADLDGGRTAYRAVQTIAQDADRSRPVREGTDRRLENLFGEGQGARSVALAVGYVRGLLERSV
jgi:phage/plasmid-like protein (TIGR03299 family)